MNPDEFNDLSNVIANKDLGFTTFSISQSALDRIIHDVYMSDLDRPPNNKLRKVIFKMGSGLEKNEKLKIVGQLIGASRKVHVDDVYQCMIDINDMEEKITISKIAKLLKCSSRTVHRNMVEELKREKELLNRSIGI